MIYLADFSPIKPEFGLFFWTVLFFVLFWLLIGKYAFKPITESLKQRENDIQDAIDSAKKAREEVNNMKAENDRILAEAREDRAKILSEAKDTKNSIINEAKEKAKEEASKVINSAMADIENQKKLAMVEVKDQVSKLALEIAEKIIRKELQSNPEQQAFSKKMVDELNLN
ncbi:MAG: F0F1 ATP synthase subunit B [Saprospiraceae bacterium]|jgi:F-type H+-transporting ATPase subunit b|nr:F0F1 ATP synthase subunit B [Saprospiraceae bacterium]MBK6478643.1 F0F1 ATP synthase subunit B [Saprospiraceae bacterium]MBK6814136.1 F0F1 ATP synthase subunit B [Saprospiraceae bacterium]MBK7373580.1 F0F1 ATP synthase subunit B [Saprospiraceae bacterium]MBK7437250.1 F0F1 ATP synthase subunit B [Saprospiraceae bacterium]